jgi:hypothetical protein
VVVEEDEKPYNISNYDSMVAEFSCEFPNI